jgi:parallel beta-helix repeat protein
MAVTSGRLQYMLEQSLSGGNSISATAYGAVGDGSTDDAAAIQAALDAAHTRGGGIVVIPPGKTFAIKTFLVVYDNTVLSAYGATIISTGNTGLLRNFLSTETPSGYAGHSHIVVQGGTWDANASDGTTGTVTAETDAFNFIHASDITVRDATIKNVSSAHALEFNAVDGGRVLNCRFLGYRDNSGDASRQYSEAVQLDIAVSGSSSIGAFDSTTSRNILVMGCYFGPSERLGVFGRAVGSHTTRAATFYDNVQIIGNRIDGTLQEGIRGYAWRRAVISDNIITGTGLSGICLTVPDPATYSVTTYGAAITGNVISGMVTDSGIRVLAYSATLYSNVRIEGNCIEGGTSANGIHVEYCARPGISGNTIRSLGSTGIYAYNTTAPQIVGNTLRDIATNAINVSTCTGGQIASNHVDTTTTNYGIYLTVTTDVAVTGNAVRAAASAGIRLGATALRTFVSANMIRKADGTTVNGVSLDATAANCVVVGNDCSGNSFTNTTWVNSGTAPTTTVIDYAGTLLTSPSTAHGANLI